MAVKRVTLRNGEVPTARLQSSSGSDPAQLTLDDWAETLNAASAVPSGPADGPEPVRLLADALAPRLAEELSHRLRAVSALDPPTAACLLTLDQLIAELPPAKP